MIPKVSIIMGIYNCEKTLSMCLDSIIWQSYENWEVIMCNDGSQDRTYEIAMEYAARDSRIKVFSNQENLGLAASLNKCLEYAEGEYIMRQDGDDLMEPTRIEKQIRYMENNICDICGTGAFIFDDSGIWGLDMPSTKPGKKSMVNDGPAIHATIIMKKSALVSVNGYSENSLTRQRLEDYDLWMKLLEKGYVFHNIDKPLYYYRVDRKSYQRRRRIFRLAEGRMRLNACKRLGLPFWMSIYALKPLVLMLLPSAFVRKLNVERLTISLRNYCCNTSASNIRL